MPFSGVPAEAILAHPGTPPILAAHLPQRALTRHAPLLASPRLRPSIGLTLLPASLALAAGPAIVPVGMPLFAFSWAVAVFLTDKYRHKYPYRYYAYLVGSHLKAAVVMALPVAFAAWWITPLQPHAGGFFKALGVFVVLDFLVSVPRRGLPPADFDPAVLESRDVAGQAVLFEVGEGEPERSGAVDSVRRLSELEGTLTPEVVKHARSSVPGLTGLAAWDVVEDRESYESRSPSGSLDLLVIDPPLNDVRRINRLLIAQSKALRMGGHLVCRYIPLEHERARLHRRWGRFFRPAFMLQFAFHRAFPKIPGINRVYFLLTRGRGRHLSRAEVWGRLSFCGFRVVAERESGEFRLVTAQRTGLPIANRRPSYYPVVGLTKVGLDGALVRTHKVRSMYPFSEFLQKQVFEDHGLAATGKFKDDFRLTEYGRVIRRYWIDELPQVFDWLRGDIKLVGIRSTSPHFLSLYPTEFIELYIRVKPGLIPPLFDENTQGFEQIVAVEWEYLRRYSRAPNSTDLRYLWATVKAIFFHGVRSK